MLAGCYQPTLSELTFVNRTQLKFCPRCVEEDVKKCGTAFPSLLVLGLGLMIVLQAMIHMLVSVSLFPVTGQQLPLISKGGSSLVFTLTALGMILGVSRQTSEKTLDNPKGESLFEKETAGKQPAGTPRNR